MPRGATLLGPTRPGTSNPLNSCGRVYPRWLPACSSGGSEVMIIACWSSGSHHPRVARDCRRDYVSSSKPVRDPSLAPAANFRAEYHVDYRALQGESFVTAHRGLRRGRLPGVVDSPILRRPEVSDSTAYR
jgi:hypothetical protein